MERLSRRLRRVLGDSAGFTLAELLVAISLMATVGLMVGHLLTSSARATAHVQRQSQAVDELRVAVSQMEREFRSAECISEPDAPSLGTEVTGPRLAFSTHSNGGTYDVTYDITGGRLVRTTSGGVERVLSELVVNADQTFTYVETPRRSVRVVLTVQDGDHDAQTVETTIAGRNAWRTC